MRLAAEISPRKKSRHNITDVYPQSESDSLNISFLLPHNKGILTFSNLGGELIPFGNCTFEESRNAALIQKQNMKFQLLIFPAVVE